MKNNDWKKALMGKHEMPMLRMNVRNQTEDEAVIDIDGEIGWASYDGEDFTWNTKEAIKKQLKDIAKMDVKKIIVNISSPGGYVDDGLAIHDVLAQHEAEIETRVTGMTASAATVIAQAGDVRKISANALYLIHRAWMLAIGNANTMKAAYEDSLKFDEVISKIYVKRTGKKESEILDLMNANDGDGKWMSAEDVIENGLADEVFEPTAKKDDSKNIVNNYYVNFTAKDELEYEDDDGNKLEDLLTDEQKNKLLNLKKRRTDLL